MKKTKKNELLRVRMQTVNLEERSITEASCETEEHKVALRFFKDFLKCHGTGFNDFDEFRCEFIPVPPTKGEKK